jgi:hypothetical protein
MTPLSSLRGAQRRGNPCACVKAEMDCFVPRNDGSVAQRRGNHPNDPAGSSLFRKDDKYRNLHFLAM